MLSFYMRKLNIFDCLCIMKSTDLIIERIRSIGEAVVLEPIGEGNDVSSVCCHALVSGIYDVQMIRWRG